MLRVAPNRSAPHIFGAASQMSTMPLGGAVVSANELALYYLSAGTNDVYVSTRLSTSLPFQPGALIPTLSADSAGPTFVTRDECLIFLSRQGTASSDIFVSRRGR